MSYYIRTGMICISVLTTAAAHATVYRVDSASTSAIPDGATWASAFRTLQDALNLELANGDEVWVAGGLVGAVKTYYPDEAGGVDSNSQSAVFQLPTVSNASDPGIRILGGFNGTESSSAARDPKKYITVLSGDIDQDGLLDADNSWHVVRGTGVQASSRVVLDGFTLTMGYADGDSVEHQSGGGVTVYEMDYGNGNPQIVNCIIEDNFSAFVGGGAHCYHAKGAFINCIFRDNATTHWGGGLYIIGGWDDVENSTTEIIRCQFINNSAGKYAGGLQIANASPLITNSLFYGNQVTGEESYYGGGALAIDCSDNVDHTAGCAVTKPVITNCTFADNGAVSGAAIAGGVLTWGWAPGFQPTLANCIFHGNDDASDNASLAETEAANLLHIGYGPPVVSNSLIEAIVDGGLFDSATNLNGDPLFTAPAVHNYRLQAASDCIDSGANEALPVDHYDLDEDGDMLEPIPFDLDREARLLDGPNLALVTPRDYDPGLPIVDMGAYEYHAGGGADSCDGDANGDGLIDPLDAGYTLSLFNCPVGQDNSSCDAADVNHDGIVDPLDVGYVMTRFGACDS